MFAQFTRNPDATYVMEILNKTRLHFKTIHFPLTFALLFSNCFDGYGQGKRRDILFSGTIGTAYVLQRACQCQTHFNPYDFPANDLGYGVSLGLELTNNNHWGLAFSERAYRSRYYVSYVHSYFTGSHGSGPAWYDYTLTRSTFINHFFMPELFYQINMGNSGIRIRLGSGLNSRLRFKYESSDHPDLPLKQSKSSAPYPFSVAVQGFQFGIDYTQTIHRRWKIILNINRGVWSGGEPADWYGAAISASYLFVRYNRDSKEFARWNE